jgi:hypothetical protein
LSRHWGWGMISTQFSWGMICWSLVGHNAGGIWLGNDGSGKTLRVSTEQDVIERRGDRILMLIIVARKTLYWRRVMRWSGQRGKIILCGVCLAGVPIFPSVDGSNGLCVAPIVVSTSETGTFITVCRSSSQHVIVGSSVLTGVLLSRAKASCFSPASSALRRPMTKSETFLF